MLIKNISPNYPLSHEITPEHIYKNRRLILKGLGFGLASLSLNNFAEASDVESLKNIAKQTSEYPGKVTPESKATSFNNFYEFGTSKEDPKKYSGNFKSKPWTLTIEGEVTKPVTIDVWDLINSTTLEEHTYRMRCVEAWSMVIPWLGVSLASILKKAELTSKAKYVVFETLYDPKQFRGQASSAAGGGIEYPYVEGLRIDEAMHPLAILAVGMYGKTLPAQNGAPIRLITPWKYGFKSIKSIVKIRLVENMPQTTWNRLASNEYGFYANVNPKVDHPRWSQASERFIGSGILGTTRQDTLMFNGYNEVANLYSDMDLKKWF